MGDSAASGSSSRYSPRPRKRLSNRAKNDSPCDRYQGADDVGGPHPHAGIAAGQQHGDHIAENVRTRVASYFVAGT